VRHAKYVLTDGRTDSPKTWCLPPTVVGGGIRKQRQKTSLFRRKDSHAKGK